MNIYEKLAAITAELSHVAKNLKVGEGKSSYKAVGEADVLAAVKPLEEKHKVSSSPYSRKIVDNDVLTSTSSYNGQERTTSKFFMRVETVYRFVNTEKPEEFVDITTYGDGMDAGDKAPGKAMTYGDKYALLKAYKQVESRKVALYGQEQNMQTWALCRMNMFLHNVDDATIWQGDTLSNPGNIKEDKLMKFQCICANPPFSLDKWDSGFLSGAVDEKGKPYREEQSCKNNCNLRAWC